MFVRFPKAACSFITDVEIFGRNEKADVTGLTSLAIIIIF